MPCRTSGADRDRGGLGVVTRDDRVEALTALLEASTASRDVAELALEHGALAGVPAEAYGALQF
jgi:hypothetical protein